MIKEEKTQACRICKHHPKVHSCSTMSLFCNIPEGPQKSGKGKSFQWAELLAVLLVVYFA